MQKLYCYVDEAGQDPKSDFFVVVVVVSDTNQDALRRQIVDTEETAKTHGLKWHKTEHQRRVRFLSLVMERHIAKGSVYVAHYRKPLPYFFPMLEVLQRAIHTAAKKSYRAQVYVDGIDRYKAKKLTNALRASGIPLRMVKGRRDESEPVIRLADMWAGCMRDALLGHSETRDLFRRAKETGYLRDIGTS